MKIKVVNTDYGIVAVLNNIECVPRRGDFIEFWTTVADNARIWVSKKVQLVAHKFDENGDFECIEVIINN